MKQHVMVLTIKVTLEGKNASVCMEITHRQIAIKHLFLRQLLYSAFFLPPPPVKGVEQGWHCSIIDGK